MDDQNEQVRESDKTCGKDRLFISTPDLQQIDDEKAQDQDKRRQHCPAVTSNPPVFDGPPAKQKTG
jgi:hypothetical protein